jgi:hypothetical protein
MQTQGVTLMSDGIYPDRKAPAGKFRLLEKVTGTVNDFDLVYDFSSLDEASVVAEATLYKQPPGKYVYLIYDTEGRLVFSAQGKRRSVWFGIITSRFTSTKYIYR